MFPFSSRSNSPNMSFSLKVRLLASGGTCTLGSFVSWPKVGCLSTPFNISSSSFLASCSSLLFLACSSAAYFLSLSSSLFFFCLSITALSSLILTYFFLPLDSASLRACFSSSTSLMRPIWVVVGPPTSPKVCVSIFSASWSSSASICV